MTTKSPAPYENNPFMIGIEGLKLIFTNAKGVGIYSIVMTVSMFLLAMVVYVIAAIVDIAQGGDSSTTFEASAQPTALDGAAIAATLVFVIVGSVVSMAISLLLFGVLEYAAGMTAKGKQVTLGESFQAVLKNFPAYLWMYILFTVKVLLWSLLLIVPGIIMFNRYLLAGTVFFAEGKRGNAALQRSAELTKGAWLTTFGGAWIWNMISQGIAAIVFWPGSVAILYRQFASKTDANEPKPPAHVLSWLTLLVPIGLFVLYVLFLIMLAVFMAALATSAR